MFHEKGDLRERDQLIAIFVSLLKNR